MKKQGIIHDALEPDGTPIRQLALEAGLKALRQRRCWRQRRKIVFGAGAAAIVLFALALSFSAKPSHSATQMVTKETQPNEFQTITTEQLIAMFPSDPIAVVDTKDGKEVLFLAESLNQKLSKMPMR